jgi:hypothetical protein
MLEGLGKYRSKALLAFATYYEQLLMVENELPERMWLNLQLIKPIGLSGKAHSRKSHD